MVIGIAIGHYFPETGKSLKPFGDGFIKLIKMVIAPIVFCTVVHGIASMSDLKKLGRIGVKTLLYFEVVSTFALVIGLVVVNLLRPGDGFHIDPATLDPSAAKGYQDKAQSLNAVTFLLNIISSSFFEPFATGDLLPVLLLAVLSAFAINGLGDLGHPVLRVIEQGQAVFFGVMRIVV